MDTEKKTKSETFCKKLEREKLEEFSVKYYYIT